MSDEYKIQLALEVLAQDIEADNTELRDSALLYLKEELVKERDASLALTILGQGFSDNGDNHEIRGISAELLNKEFTK